MEVLAAVFLTSLVIGVAVAFYLNLASSSARASERVRQALHATAVLDRIVRDLEGASLLVKPDEVDPLSHPWLFLARSDHAMGGADHIKFITRSQTPRVTTYHTSDLALVAYSLVTDDGVSYQLYRWLSPGLPLDFDATFPLVDDSRSMLLAERLSAFSLRFLGEEGEWLEEWDSSLLVQSSKIPHVVEIQLALMEEGTEELDPEEIPYFTRRVALPLRPLDMAELIDEALEAEDSQAGAGDAADGSGEDGASAGATSSAAECVEANWDRCLRDVGEFFCSQILDGSLPIDTTGIDLSAWGCP